jgi:DNA-binding transcriptional ArsR family regulator
MKHGPDISKLAAVIGDPARAAMLSALMSGKALTSSELAAEAGVGAATASSHLAKLLDAGLVRVRAQGRHRYWTLADAEVAHVLETLMGLAARTLGRVRIGPKDVAMRKARVCYDHLAGDYGVRLFSALLEKNVIVEMDDGISLGRNSTRFVTEMGLNLKPGRPVCRACLDWSERRTHLAGGLGAALLTRFLDLGWARRDAATRAVHFTADGERQFLLLTRRTDAILKREDSIPGHEKVNL